MGGGLGNSFDIRDLKALEEKAKKELSNGKKNVFISFAPLSAASFNRGIPVRSPAT